MQQRYNYDTMKKILFYFVCLLCCYSCSETTPTEMDVDTAQHYYDTMKGTYIGNIMVDNIPQKISVTIANDITTKPLPLKPILSRIFTDKAELDEAEANAGSAAFTMDVDYMAIVGGNAVLSLEPKDLIFTTTVKQKDYKVSALMETSIFVIRATDELSLSMIVKELSCDGKSYDVKTNGITYLIDYAKKDQN